MNRVFVLDARKQPLMPCTQQRAYELLRKRHAVIYRHVPFTIVLKTARPNAVRQPLEIRIDPGSKITGIALVANDRVVFAAELTHRGASIRKALAQRAAYRRRRRNANLRHRPPRFDNRTRKEGWLPPSLQSRVDNVVSVCTHLSAPLTGIAVETVRFDMQTMQNPGISGVEYQQGTLLGYEVREYLLEKWQRTCAYCDAKPVRCRTGCPVPGRHGGTGNVPLEIDHVVPSSAGGSSRVSNLTLACHACNSAKSALRIDDFLAHNPTRLARIKAQLKAPLNDAAAVNATRNAIRRELTRATGLPLASWSGGRTKFNRCSQGYPKTHWIDAACVGESGISVHLDPAMPALTIKAIGRGTWQTRRNDAYGFPRGAAKHIKDVRGFRTGDLVRLSQPTGKYAGSHVGNVAVRARGDFDVATPIGKITAPATRFSLVQRNTGYAPVA